MKWSSEKNMDFKDLSMADMWLKLLFFVYPEIQI